ncbi:type 1 glutamine amidotransferase [Methylobacterium soli]|uniref:Type 1 glutamine amidotransferase n=1 Tax=Methylobacterium soli TaxID=553447 RepID=A0A6L3T910_9HYPH|nr:type 1 glutamine amidotransferase [Methylobacterium soli]KAB1081772.1 type 1 glutamine amidotransferase [Methylobacterium soli]
MLNILVADGNARDGRAGRIAATGQSSAQAYAAILKALAPDIVATILNPADADAALPGGVGLASFDGVIVTGSELHVTDETPAVQRQIALMRDCLAAGLAVFGSCWGVQVAAVVAGGRAGRNPRGPEFGFARRIVPTRSGQAHPLLSGRPAAFDAPAMHLDAVIEPPPDCRVLAENGLLAVQAIEIVRGEGVFWGTQYHPELDLDAVAAMLRLSSAEVVEAGLCRTPGEVEAYAAELDALHADPEGRLDLVWRHGLGPEVMAPIRRRREIANFLDRLVRPRARR